MTKRAKDDYFLWLPPILISLLLFMLLWRALACYYDYSVSANDPQLIYPCQYYGCAEQKREFTSMLYTTRPGEDTAAKWVVVEIDHLRRKGRGKE